MPTKEERTSRQAEIRQKKVDELRLLEKYEALMRKYASGTEKVHVDRAVKKNENGLYSTIIQIGDRKAEVSLKSIDIAEYGGFLDREVAIQVGNLEGRSVDEVAPEHFDHTAERQAKVKETLAEAGHVVELETKAP